ncbi:8-oxo-dGTP diphosphatase MutT [Natronospirillum operosum]|uniref:8-oxo-dGTP diphosphatase n=1 Tax=Natronospirillum operosum TaxID=2759953 RepID=A0A4Z0W680_9GAMM|nr:8-oxo-dGTP diphosphatase MutT [Natronospirillum operosum]TGG92735.1 8-oxo-dGTP diphosphatase MutT [Natronospirillum operosum]
MTATASELTPTVVRVAVGVLVNDQRQVLIARRAAHQHQGGRWEFPGGKIEGRENLAEALTREFAEEVGLVLDIPADLAPWQVIEHDYGDKRVCLEVAQIGAYSGQPEGREGQEVRWMPVQALNPEEFPAANISIIEALQADCA